jgi:hypothetical protein
MIQTTAVKRALKTLSFEIYSAVDFESGYYRVKADLDLLIWIVLPYLIILLSQLSFRKLSWFSQKENY